MRHNPVPPPYAPLGDGQQYPSPVYPRKRRVWPILIGALAVGLAACFIGLFVFGGLAAHEAAKDLSSTPATIEPPASSGGTRKAPATLANGDHEDVKAGTYSTTAPADGFGCTWERVSSMDNEPDSFITGDVVPAGGTGIMVVKSTDAGVRLSGGCTWKRK